MPEPALIDDELAAFLQSGVGISAASRSRDRVPDLARAVGCRVSADRRRVTIFFLASQCGGMLADFRDNGAIAAVFSLPVGLRTVQLKGNDAAVEAPGEGDARLIARYRAAFGSSLVQVGYDASLPRTLLAGAAAEFVAVTFTPTAAFSQTPGPNAGARLAAAK